jgi:plasmid stabilization system protein ParE
LLDFPEFGAKWESDDPQLQDLRVCLVREFRKYLLFYRITGDEIIVVRIIHGHRKLPEALKE